MGTRADFYVGRGTEAEWLGSIAWDGYPDGLPKYLLDPADEREFRADVADFLIDREDGTTPKMGWPWPWEDSQTTDFSYAWDDGKVWTSCFGHPWQVATEYTDEEHQQDDAPPAVFPNMTDRQNITLGKRSGVMVIGKRDDD